MENKNTQISMNKINYGKLITNLDVLKELLVAELVFAPNNNLADKLNKYLKLLDTWTIPL